MSFWDKINSLIPSLSPTTVGGYTINYDDSGPLCDDCGARTYHTFEDRSIVYCPKCKRLMYVNMLTSH